jgi:hypothetical protein
LYTKLKENKTLLSGSVLAVKDGSNHATRSILVLPVEATSFPVIDTNVGFQSLNPTNLSFVVSKSILRLSETMSVKSVTVTFRDTVSPEHAVVEPMVVTGALGAEVTVSVTLCGVDVPHALLATTDKVPPVVGAKVIEEPVPLGARVPV